MTERFCLFKNQCRGQFYDLGIGSLGYFLVGKFYPNLVNIETDVGLVFNGEVYEK